MCSLCELSCCGLACSLDIFDIYVVKLICAFIFSKVTVI